MKYENYSLFFHLGKKSESSSEEGKATLEGNLTTAPIYDRENKDSENALCHKTDVEKPDTKKDNEKPVSNEIVIPSEEEWKQVMFCLLFAWYLITSYYSFN